MEDLKILTQLYNGNHLEPKELERARQLLHGLKKELYNNLINQQYRRL